MSKLLVIDGLDGSGKGSIAKMLKDYLSKTGRNHDSISFPMYDRESSSLVKLYLGGALGGAPEDTNAYAASMLFAADRYVSYRTYWQELYKKENSVLIADRYTTANAVHQLTKIPKEQWGSFLDWLFDFEYNKLGLPVPDATVYMEMPPDLCRKMIAKRAAETGRTVDIHEKDTTHLDKAYEAALYAADRLHWIKVKNYVGTELRPLEEVFEEVLEKTGLK